MTPVDAERGRALLAEAADEIEALGVGHLAERARTLSAT
jgi:hypothetical protein